jgi:hypothetical protein
MNREGERGREEKTNLDELNAFHGTAGMGSRLDGGREEVPPWWEQLEPRRAYLGWAAYTSLLGSNKDTLTVSGSALI